MDHLRTVLATIQKHLGGMNPSQKLLIGSLAVIMLMTLFLVSQYAGRPAMVELLPGASVEDQKRAATILQASNITIKPDATGRIMVPAERRLDAIAALSQAGHQLSNSDVIFENILKTQNWMNSREQNRQIYKVMLDNWLSSVVSRFDGIQRASVFVDIPESIGFGQSARPPKASVTLFTQPGRVLDQAKVDAAARLVAGSISGLELSRVAVMDGTQGVPRRVTLEDDLAPSSYREYAMSVERQYRQKLENLLIDIQPPPVVEVTAHVDITRIRAQIDRKLPAGDGSVSIVSRETLSSSTEAMPSAGAEPGVRSNTGADISLGPGRASRSEQKEEQTEFMTAVGTRREQIDDPRGHPTSLVATVAIPRSFIASLIQRDRPDGGQAQPTEAEIDQRFSAERDRLTRFLRPHLQAQGPQGEAVAGTIEITLMSGDPMFFAGGGGLSGGSPLRTAGYMPGNGGGGGGGGGGAFATILLMGSGMIDKLVLGVLAVIALAMMVLMVRKAGRQPDTPSAEELAGLPPALETTSDLVGEADETETAIPGILVGEEEIKATKLREQVADLIRKDPEVAGKMLNRWVAVEQ